MEEAGSDQNMLCNNVNHRGKNICVSCPSWEKVLENTFYFKIDGIWLSLAIGKG